MIVHVILIVSGFFGLLALITLVGDFIRGFRDRRVKREIKRVLILDKLDPENALSAVKVSLNSAPTPEAVALLDKMLNDLGDRETAKVFGQAMHERN